MPTERELAYSLRLACKRLIRDGHKGHIIEEIQEILSEWNALEESDELDTE